MAKRSIEETFRAVAPRHRRGIPEAPVLTAGFVSGGTSAASGSTELATSLSPAGQQITQLQRAYQQQGSLITANTQAILGNTAAQGSRSGSAVGQAASTVLGGALGFLSPVISGIASLFGSASNQQAPLPIYTPPAPISVKGTLTPTGPTAGVSPSAAAPSGQAAHVTVNINAIDSQSILDRSSDIADAVREAMLNLHPINNVIANL